MAVHSKIKTQDKKSEQEYFNDYVSEYGDHDLCVAESYELVLREFGLDGRGNSLKTIDLGCGTGLWSEMIAGRGHKVWGFDLTLSMARAGKSRKGLQVGFSPFVGDVERMAVKSETFDVCFGAGILHHLPSLSQMLSEMERALKKGGRFCFYEPNGSNPLMRMSYLLRIVFDRFMKATGRFSSVNEKTHPLTFYEREFHGKFKDLRIKPIYITQKHNPAFKGIFSFAMKSREALIDFLHRVLPARYGCNFVLIMGKRK